MVTATANTDDRLRFSLHPKQFAFYRSTEPLTAFIGGRGSGKSVAGSIFAYGRCSKYPRATGFIGANTYDQLLKSTLKKMFKMLNQFKTRYVFNKAPPWGHSQFEKHENILSLDNGAQIICKSLDHWEDVLGEDLGWAWLDETWETSPDALTGIMGCLRGFSDTYPDMDYPVRITTTPNGFDWVWENFASDKRLPGATYVTATTYDNARHLPKLFAEGFESRLSKNLARQAVYGEFINIAKGRAYEFKRERHVRECAFLPGLPVILSQDFNVAPMCGIVMQVDKPNRRAWALDEIVIPDNAQSVESSREFVRRYGGKLREWSVHIHGDASGSRRDTRGTDSDFALMLKPLREIWPDAHKCIRYNANPRVLDRVNAVNALLDPAMEKGQEKEPKLIINPRCETLIRDLQMTTFKPGTQELDKKDALRTHCCFAPGTLVDTPARALPIERIKAGQEVFTHLGIGRVLEVKSTGIQATLLLTHKDTLLQCTATHPFLTEDGWKAAREIAGSRLWRRESSVSKSKALPSNIGADISALVRAAITNQRMLTTAANFIRWYGMITSGLGMGDTSTILMAIRKTIHPKIWNWLRLANINAYTPRTWTRRVHSPLCGTPLLTAESGTAFTASERGPEGKLLPSAAGFAECFLRPISRKRNCAQGTARQSKDGEAVLTMLRGIASTAEGHSRAIATRLRAFAPVNARPGDKPKVEPGPEAETFNLKTTHGTFYAQGLLCSNLDALGYPIADLLPAGGGHTASAYKDVDLIPERR